MTPPVVTAREHFSIPETARMMVEERVHRVLILNAAGQLSGILSSMDIVRVVYEICFREPGRPT